MQREDSERELRDKRWELVAARVGTPLMTAEEFVAGHAVGVTEFRIEVRHEGMTWYSVIRVMDEDLAQYPELYGHILQEMVEQIDEKLDE